MTSHVGLGESHESCDQKSPSREGDCLQEPIKGLAAQPFNSYVDLFPCDEMIRRSRTVNI
jgi:hypothetical protein